MFDQMFEGVEGVECFANDARISTKQWMKSTLNDLIRKVDITGSADLASGSDRIHFVRMQDNIHVVVELVCSQEGQPQPGTSRSPTEILEKCNIVRFRDL